MTVYEVVLDGQNAGEPMKTVLHYDITGSDDLQALSDAIAILMQGDLDTMLVAGAQYFGINARIDSPGEIGVNYPFTGGAITGNYADPDTFGMIAANVRKNTSSGSRPANGRIFQGGVPAVVASPGGGIDTTWRINLRDFWLTMVTIAFDGTGTAAMVIKASNPTAPNTVPYNPVTGITVLERPAKQSRRNFQT